MDFAYANDDFTNSYMNSDPLTLGDYSFDYNNSDWFGPPSYLADNYDNTDYQNNFFDLGSMLANSGYLPTDDYNMPDLSALFSNPEFAGATSMDDISVNDLQNIAPWADAGAYSTQMQALQDAELNNQGYTQTLGNPGFYEDDKGNLRTLDDIVMDQKAAMSRAPSLQNAVEGVGGIRPEFKGYGTPGDSAGLRGNIAHNLKGGLTTVDNGDRLRTYGTESYFDNVGGQGIYVDGAPNRATSLADLQMLDDGGSAAWAKNADSSWADYANKNGYNPSDIGEDARYLLNGKLSSLTGDKPREGNLLQKAAQLGADLLRGKPASQQGSSGSQSGARGNGVTNGGGNNSAGMSALSMLAQALGAMQQKGKAPAPTGDPQHAKDMRWSRKAGSGRQNKASGGLLQMAKGGRMAGGQDDVIPINAAPGEYVMDAESVSALGDGSTEAGAAKLDQMRHNIRKHKRAGALGKIPPKAKSTDKYMKGAR